MILTKSKVAMLLVSAVGALFISHKHQEHTPGVVHTLSTVTVTGGSPEPKIEPAPAPPAPAVKPADDPCVCPPTAVASPPPDLGNR